MSSICNFLYLVVQKDVVFPALLARFSMICERYLASFWLCVFKMILEMSHNHKAKLHPISLCILIVY